MFGFMSMPDAIDVEFLEFWAKYPRHVARITAKKAYVRARRAGATQQQLLEGVDRYIANKPSYADYCHASTWLNAGRWLDEYDTPAAPRLWLCPDDPPCPASTTQWDCAKRAALEKARRARQAS